MNTFTPADITSDEPMLISRKRAAAKLDISEREVDRLIADGLLDVRYIGRLVRVTTRSLLDYANNLRQEAS